MSRTTAGFVWSFAILSIAAFVFTVFRCYHIPLAHDEVATFYYYIQPGSFIPFYAHPDSRNLKNYIILFPIFTYISPFD